MNRTQLLDHHSEICTKARALMERKNHDYTGSAGDDPFGNFTTVEAIGLCSTETGLLVRLLDKFKRFVAFIESGELKVTDESLEDTVLDGINYFILLGAYIKSKREAGEAVSEIVELSVVQVADWLENPANFDALQAVMNSAKPASFRSAARAGDQIVRAIAEPGKATNPTTFRSVRSNNHHYGGDE